MRNTKADIPRSIKSIAKFVGKKCGIAQLLHTKKNVNKHLS
jgi:hypothetical protein